MFAALAHSALAAEGKGEGIAMKETVLEGGGGTIKCPEKGIKVVYEIQKPTKEVEPKWEEQEFSNPGKDLKLVVEWPAGACKATAGVLEAAATVSACELHLQDTSEKSTNEVEALGSTLSACVAKTEIFGFACEITIPRGKESEKVNSNLKKNWLTNVGTENLNIKATDEGVTTEVKGGGCKSAGITATKEGKLKGELLAKGVIHL
jgi:hypothetical protein